MTKGRSPTYKRVLLKLSGEAFCPTGESGLNTEETTSIAEQIRGIRDAG